MSPSPASFRFPNTIPEEAAHPAVQKAIKDTFSALTDIYQAIPHLKSQIDALHAGMTTIVNQGSGGGTVIINGSNFPGLGGLNNQTGNTSYTTTQSDDGILLWLNNASPVAVSLNSALTTPFFLFAFNAGAGTVTFTPTSGTISYLSNLGSASMPLATGLFALIVFDGVNWWAATTAASTGSGAVVQIAKTVLGAPASNFTFSAIPGTYSSLKLVIVGQTTGASNTFICIQVNGDTGANYDVGGIFNNASSAGGFSAAGQTFYSTGAVVPPSSATGRANASTLDFPLYASTAFFKQMVCYQEGWASSFIQSVLCAGDWKSTAAITSMLIFLNSGNFVAGSTAILYGIA